MSTVWNIGLFSKLKGENKAECLDCKENGKEKYTFSIKDGSTKGLLKHFDTVHKDSEYKRKFDAIENEKKNPKDAGALDKFFKPSTGDLLFF